MVSIPSLWLPILLAAVLVFVASSIIHMALKYHSTDFKKLPDEDGVMDALRPFAIPPGDYVVPFAGSTEVMRSEHDRMRSLLDVMGAALERGDPDELLDQGDSLLLLIQQHNQKEEGVLYPRAQQLLASEWPSLHARLESGE